MRLTKTIGILLAALALTPAPAATPTGPCYGVDGAAYCCIDGRLRRRAIRVDCADVGSIFANCGGGGLSLCPAFGVSHWQMPCSCACGLSASGTCWFTFECNPLAQQLCCYDDVCDERWVEDFVPDCIQPTNECPLFVCFENYQDFYLEHGPCE